MFWFHYVKILIIFLFISLLTRRCSMYHICRMDWYRDKLDFDDYDYLELELQIVLHFLWMPRGYSRACVIVFTYK